MQRYDSHNDFKKFKIDKREKNNYKKLKSNKKTKFKIKKDEEPSETRIHSINCFS